jgi:hypothetical protein
MPSLSRAEVETDLLGAGVVRARPPHNYACRFKEQKNFKGKKADNMLSISSLFVNNLMLP